MSKDEPKALQWMAQLVERAVEEESDLANVLCPQVAGNMRSPFDADRFQDFRVDVTLLFSSERRTGAVVTGFLPSFSEMLYRSVLVALVLMPKPPNRR